MYSVLCVSVEDVMLRMVVGERVVKQPCAMCVISAVMNVYALCRSG